MLLLIHIDNLVTYAIVTNLLQARTKSLILINYIPEEDLILLPTYHRYVDIHND